MHVAVSLRERGRDLVAIGIEVDAEVDVLVARERPSLADDAEHHPTHQVMADPGGLQAVAGVAHGRQQLRLRHRVLRFRAVVRGGLGCEGRQQRRQRLQYMRASGRSITEQAADFRHRLLQAHRARVARQRPRQYCGSLRVLSDRLMHQAQVEGSGFQASREPMRAMRGLRGIAAHAQVPAGRTQVHPGIGIPAIPLDRACRVCVGGLVIAQA